MAPRGEAGKDLGCVICRISSLYPLAVPAVIPPVEALVVERSVDPDPIGLVDPPAVPSCGAVGEGARELDPASLLPRDGPNLLGDLRKILILAEDECHVVFAPVGERDHIERDPHIDPLLFAGQKGVLRAVGQIHPAVALSEWPAVHDHAPPPHRGELVGPEGVPPGVVADIEDSGVEADLRQFPSLPRANCSTSAASS